MHTEFSLKLLPATYGDSLWITYGTPDDLHYILIDGGTGGTKEHILKEIEKLPEGKRILDLVIITHIDRDHIEGMLSLLNENHLNFKVKDLWYNGWSHLHGNNIESFGSKQGEKVSAQIIKHKIPWNGAFKNGPVAIPTDTKLPIIDLDGGMRVTLLSPTQEHLTNLIPYWQKELEKANLIPGYGELIQEEKKIQDVNPEEIERFGGESPDIENLNKETFEEDDSKANASSIAFLAEFDDRRLLCLGDAEPTQITMSLRKIWPQGKFPINLFKISHHGSLGNTGPELLELTDCKNFAISTNGSNYYHPAPETVAWIIKRAGPNINLYFNYESEYNKIWKSSSLSKLFKYKYEFGNGEIKIIVPANKEKN